MQKNADNSNSQHDPHGENTSKDKSQKQIKPEKKQEGHYKYGLVVTARTYKPPKGRTYIQPSKTQPDLTIPMAVLLERHTRGIPLGATAHKGEFFEDEIIPQINDLTDLTERREELENRQITLMDEIEERKQERLRNQAEQEALIEQDLQQRATDQQQTSPSGDS